MGHTQTSGLSRIPEDLAHLQPLGRQTHVGISPPIELDGKRAE